MTGDTIAASLRTEIGNAMAQAVEADRQSRRLVRDLFPTGSLVRWRHGDSIRSGTVRDSCGSNMAALRFSVESGSGRTYWIGAYRLLSFVGLGGGR